MKRAVLTTALVALLALAAPMADAAKKKPKKRPGTVDITKVVNQPLPEPTSTTGVLAPLFSMIDVGKQFKGLKVRDVNATLQTTGMDGSSGPSAAFDVQARLTSPNGATATLFGPFDLGGNPIGPLTLDDESPFFVSSSPVAVDPEALNQPYIGTAKPDDPLAVMDGGPVQGTWTLEATDFPFIFGGNGGTSTLVQWRLNVIAGKPFRTK